MERKLKKREDQATKDGSNTVIIYLKRITTSRLQEQPKNNQQIQKTKNHHHCIRKLKRLSIKN